MVDTLSLFGLFAGLLAIVDVGHGQTLIPSSNQTVPNNQPGNVNYTCRVPSGLLLNWQINSRFVNSAVLDALGELGLVVLMQDETESTLIITAEARTSINTIEVRCVAVNFEEFPSVSISDAYYVNTYGSPGAPLNFEVIPYTVNTLLISWDAPNAPPWFPVMYNTSIINLSSPTHVIKSVTTNETSIEYVEEETLGCNQFQFEVFAFNSAGASDAISIIENFPFSPNLTATSASLTIDYVDLIDPTSAEIRVSFQRASSCSERFYVTNHSVVVVRGDGEVVRENTTTSSEVNLQLVVGGIERDTQFSVQVVVCNVLTCRRSSPRELLTTDVQSAAALFFETFISLGCTFARHSSARGCVVTLQVEGKGGREEFQLKRENGTAVAIRQCYQTEISVMAYEMISAADWESDGSTGSHIISVVTTVANNEGDFPCPTAIDLYFINNTPELVGNTVSAEFRANRPGLEIHCHLTRFFKQDCSNGTYRHTGIPSGDYVLRVIARDPVRGERKVIRSRLLVHSNDPSDPFCITYLINHGWRVEGRNVTVEFTSTGIASGFECALDRAEHVDCASPHTVANLSPGVHHIRVKPVGCGREYRIWKQRFIII